MKKTLLILSLSLTFPLFAQLPNYVPTAGILGWWDFDGTGNDLSGNGNHLTNYGASYTLDRFGNANAAGQFSGSNQYQVVNAPSFSFGQNGSFTVSLWIRKPSVNYGVLIMSGQPNGGPFVWNLQSSNTGNLQFGTNRQGMAWSWAQNTHPVNQWMHAVATFSNGAMVLYINGVQAATATYTHTSATQQTLPLYIGRGVSGNYSQADIDDIGIWNRVLTATEIADLYQGCGAQVAQQPTSLLRTIGEDARFGVAGVGSGLSFEWQYNDGSSWQPVSNAGQFSGAQSDSLTVANVDIANDNLQLRCILTESITCADTSDIVTLSVCGEVTDEPKDTSVAVNTSASFSVTHSDPNATFQWQIGDGSGSFSNLVAGLNYQGVTTNTLTIVNAALAMDQETYRCLIVSGSCTGNSAVATLTVLNNISTFNSSLGQLQLYPNPASSSIKITFAANKKQANYAIANTVGATLLEGLAKSDEAIDISNLPKGSYVLIVENQHALPFVKM